MGQQEVFNNLSMDTWKTVKELSEELGIGIASIQISVKKLYERSAILKRHIKGNSSGYEYSLIPK